MTEPNDHAAERRGWDEAIAYAAAHNTWISTIRAMEAERDRLHPPPEPERVWVKWVAGETARDPDGKWYHRWTKDGLVSEFCVSDAMIRALASLVPGLVAKPVEPTAWLLLKWGEWDDVIRCATLDSARKVVADQLHPKDWEIIPIVELPEVPRDA